MILQSPARLALEALEGPWPPGPRSAGGDMEFWVLFFAHFARAVTSRAVAKGSKSNVKSKPGAADLWILGLMI